MKIAVSGKGGVGKTTIAAALVKLFSGANHRVYAIDADPDVCLAATLGIPDDITSELKPLVEMKELIYARTGGEGSFFTLNPEIDDVLDDFCICLDNIRYLRMGGVKKGGSSCYCRRMPSSMQLSRLCFWTEMTWSLWIWVPGLSTFPRYGQGSRFNACGGGAWPEQC